MTDQTSPAPGRPNWPEIVLPAGHAVTVGRGSRADVRLEHASISRSHVRLLLGDAHVDVEDLGSRFGTQINGVPVRQGLLAAGDALRIGSSPVYHLQGRVLRCSALHGGMEVRMENVGIARAGRVLLDGVTAEFAPDTFVGLLGPSGAGKSLFLGCVSSSIAPDTGRVTFDDGLDVTANQEVYRAQVGVVTQDDVVYPELTVRENLLLAAALRLPAASAEERRARSQVVMDQVALGERADTLVGVLSGGQRKRVSVAVELLAGPRLLLLDEPTSGLDPGLQARLMETLRMLRRLNMTVLCSTHTMDTLNFFDSVVVLGMRQGIARVAFAGPPQALLTTFGVSNPADLFDRLGQLNNAQEPGPPGHEGTKTGEFTRRARSVRPRVSEELGVAGLARQAILVLRRTALCAWRDRAATVLALAMPVVLAVLTCFAEARSTVAIAPEFYVIIASLWLGMSLTVREIVRERPLYARDRLAGLRPMAYLGGKLAFALLAASVQSVLLYGTFRVASKYLEGALAVQRIERCPIATGFFLLTLTAFGGGVIGLLVSTIARSERAAVALLPLALLPQVLLSRVGAGDAARGWSAASPYCPLVRIPYSISHHFGMELSAQAGSTGVTQKVLSCLASLPMLSRPATALTNMMGQRRLPWEWAAGEFIYFIILIFGFTALLGFLFQAREKRWLSTR